MQSEHNKHPTHLGGQGRQSGGYSLRKALENQGITTEEEMRAHLNKIGRALSVKPNLDITRYKAR